MKHRLGAIFQKTLVQLGPALTAPKNIKNLHNLWTVKTAKTVKTAR